MTAPLILRRLKSDVLKDLPPRTEINIPVVMSDDERTMYEALRLKAVHELTDSKISDSENGQGSSRISILAHLMKLRCFCCHPALAVPGIQLEGSKLIVLRDIVMQIVSGKHKVLVFSQFIRFLKRAEAVFQKDGLRTLYFDGSTDGEERMNKINAFQRGE